MLSVQKNEKNHKNSTHSKMQFYIIFIYIFFYIKIFTDKGGGRWQAGGIRNQENLKNRKSSPHSKIKILYNLI